MRYYDGQTDLMATQDSVVVLGNFDGIHKGHQKLFKVAKEKASRYGLQTVVFSFYPHPTWVLGEHPKQLLMSRNDKIHGVEQLGMDVLIEYPFTEKFARIMPETFFVEILLKKLKTKVLIIGSNYYFGYQKQGDCNYLRQLGEKYGIEICVVNAVKYGEEMISSSAIRGYIMKGSIERANEMLGHPYGMTGEVVKGKQLGRTIGFPTINLVAEPDRVYPPDGVYATLTKQSDTIYRSITNIGCNPTLQGKRKMIETHIFEFNQDIYGQDVEVEFYKGIRLEHQFENIEALKAQIGKDTLKVKDFFENHSNLIAKRKEL